MVLVYIFGVVVSFLIVVAGSYVGAKMALNAFFGRDFDPANLDRGGQTVSTSDQID